MDNLVEQVARAAFAYSQGRGTWADETFDGEAMRSVREAYFDLARAVIPVVMEWLKEPTVEMAQAGEAALWDAAVGDLHINDARDCWEAMLAAAIRGEG
jgi:hypothetical protein